MTIPADREFAVLRRGEVRDAILRNFREGLRQLTNPETGATFTEDEIARATQAKSRWFIEAQAIDDYAQGEQKRALYLADQVRVERASTSWLEGYHARLWGKEKLAATGGSGTVSAEAVAGTIIVGSTTIPDSAAYQARDSRGNRYQAFQTVTTPAGGTATVTLKAIDTGSTTNPELGETLTWINRDPNMKPTCTVSGDDFSGGTDRETDAEHASRIMGSIQHKEAAGNDAHMRAWARAASNAVEDAFIYPTAFHAGSVLVAVTQKRTTDGPNGRIPSVGTLASVTAYMVPPNSPVVPTPPFVIVVPTVAETSDVVLKLNLARGSDAGWTDATTFPSYHASTPAITSVASQTQFDFLASGDATLPDQAALATLSGANAPQLMVWDEANSVFETLSVSSVEDLGSNTYRVVLTSSPTVTLAAGIVVCPAMARHAIVSSAVEGYFDERGPGDLFDPDADPRGARCLRFPLTSERWPFRAGAEVATKVIEALGGTSSDATMASMSQTEPTYPTDLSTGPRMLTLGKLGVYEL